MRRFIAIFAVAAIALITSACNPNDPVHVRAFFDLNPDVPAEELTLGTMNEAQRAVVKALQDRQTAFYLGIIAAESVDNNRRAIQLNSFLTCVRHHESDRGGYPHTNGYGAQNPYSSASGAYQFIDSTWRNVSARSGHGGYPTAASAPWWVQDAVAYWVINSPVSVSGGRGNWAGTGCPGT